MPRKLIQLTVEDGCQREFTVEAKDSPMCGLYVAYRPAGPTRTREYLYEPHDDAAGWVRKTAKLLAEHILDWNIADPDRKGQPLPITAEAIAGPAAKPVVGPEGQPAPPRPKHAVEYPVLEFLVNLITGYQNSREAEADRKN